ncbi:MAG: branched-chain amino acid ABC transporter permease [Rhodospirillales bacterium]
MQQMVLTRLGPLALLVLAAAFVMPEWLVSLATVAFAKGLVVLGLLVLWRAGLVSFGQALYFAGGAYAAGLLAHSGGIREAAVLVPAGALAGALLAFVTGFLLARYRAIFFAMLSLAFSMILYGILVKNAELGSTDGIGLPPISFLGFLPDEGGRTLSSYVMVVLVSFLAALLVEIYLRSIPGSLAEPIRDNEVRVEYLGLSVKNLIHAKLVIAGALAGLGGAITAIAVGHIDPDSMAYWTISGGFVFITILAGAGSVLAPFVGALLFELVRSYAVAYAPELWQLILGAALLAVIMFLPGGLWSLFKRRAEGS